MSLTKVLCAASLLLAACSAEVAESTGTSEDALKATPAAAFKWEENATRDEVTISGHPRIVGNPYNTINPGATPSGVANVADEATQLRPKYVQFSGTAPLTPSEGNPCGLCTR